MVEPENLELFITADRVVVCTAHIDQYLDAPLVIATARDYDVWFHTRGTSMTCERCEARHHDKNRDNLASDFLGAVGTSWGERTDGVGEIDREIARCFDTAVSGVDIDV